MVVELDYDVAAPESSSSRRSTGQHLGDHGAMRLRHFCSSRRLCRDLLDINAEPTAYDFAPSAKLGQFLFDQIDRDREPDPNVQPAAGINRRINTHHCTIQANQRSTGIARINRRIGLNKGIVVAWNKTSLGADNAGCDRMVEAEGVAN